MKALSFRMSFCHLSCFQVRVEQIGMARKRVKQDAVDWTDCPLIERVPGKLGGVPVIRYSRVRPDGLLVNRGGARNGWPTPTGCRSTPCAKCWPSTTSMRSGLRLLDHDVAAPLIHRCADGPRQRRTVLHFRGP